MKCNNYEYHNLDKYRKNEHLCNTLLKENSTY